MAGETIQVIARPLVDDPVIGHALRAGGGCRWSIYKDPSLVPEEAYTSVGHEKSTAAGAHGGAPV